MLKKNFIRISVVFLLLIAGLVSCGEKNKEGFTVEGNLENIEGGYFIAAREFRDSMIVDTVHVDDKGRFTIKGDVDTLSTLSIYMNNNSRYTYFFVDKGIKVNITGDALYPDLLDIKGGDVNDDLTAFKKQHKDLIKKRTEILKLVEDSSYTEDESSVVTDKNYVMELKNINFELSNIIADYVKNNPDKIASVVLIHAIFKNEANLTRLDESLSQLRGAAATYYQAKELFDYSNKIRRSSEGAVSPNFTRKDIKGKEHSLVSFRGKYLFLFFVSTTCPLCEIQRPEVMALYNKFKQQKENIEFLTVVINTEEAPVSDEIKRSVKWPILIEDGGWSSDLLDLYNIHEVPFYTIISPTGVILRRDIPLDMVDETVAELTGKK